MIVLIVNNKLKVDESSSVISHRFLEVLLYFDRVDFRVFYFYVTWIETRCQFSGKYDTIRKTMNISVLYIKLGLFEK